MFYKEPKYFVTKTLEPNEDHYHQRIQKKKKRSRSSRSKQARKGVAEIPIADFCQWQGNLWFAIYFEYG